MRRVYCAHILTRTQGNKFDNMFLVKIASKGTSLIYEHIIYHVKDDCAFSLLHQELPQILVLCFP